MQAILTGRERGDLVMVVVDMEKKSLVVGRTDLWTDLRFRRGKRQSIGGGVAIRDLLERRWSAYNTK